MIFYIITQTHSNHLLSSSSVGNINSYRSSSSRFFYGDGYDDYDYYCCC